MYNKQFFEKVFSNKRMERYFKAHQNEQKAILHYQCNVELAEAFYDASTMGLRSVDYARNSKGKSVLVRETGWADAGETPSHLVLQFSSSHGGAYVGTVGNTFWVDNVGLVY